MVFLDFHYETLFLYDKSRLKLTWLDPILEIFRISLLLMRTLS